MVNCVFVNKTKKVLCLGSLSKRIEILDRDITADDSSVDFTETFSNTVSCKAMIETTSGVDIFNGTEILGSATHLFTIKYKTSINAQKFVKFKSKYYDILQVENVDEDDNFLVLRCRERGDVTKKANWA